VRTGSKIFGRLKRRCVWTGVSMSVNFAFSNVNTEWRYLAKGIKSFFLLKPKNGF